MTRPANFDVSTVLQPIETARGLPNAHYIDPQVYAKEARAVMFASWPSIGFAFDCPNAGDVMPIEFMGMPLLIVRDDDGDIGVFQNTCRHRGMILVAEKGNLRGTIRCKYHSWCYGLKGELRSTPHVGGPGQNLHDSIDRTTLGLKRIRSHVWRDIIFVNIDEQAPAFEDYAAPLIARMKDFTAPHYPGGGGFRFDVACNWKLAVENYCESYHLPWIHPGLNSYSRLEDHYHIDAGGPCAGQGTTVYRQIQGDKGETFPDFAGLGDFWNEGAEYPVLFPNTLLAFQRDHNYVLIVQPCATDRSIERVELFYPFEPQARADLKPLMEKNKSQWKSVLEEDLCVVEGMQKGRHGIYFDGGKFSPVMDTPTYDFHQWVGEKLARDGGETVQ